MASEIAILATDILKNNSIDDAEKRDLLKAFIDKLLDNGKYSDASGLVSGLVFSDNKYIFDHIVDEWLRYDQLFLEIVTSEMNYCDDTPPAAVFRDRDVFRRVVTEAKFAIREVWFDLPGAKEQLMGVRAKHTLTPHFLAVVCKAAVQKEFTSAVFLRMADMLQDKSEYDSELLKAYARFFDSENGTSAIGALSVLYPPKNRDDNARVKIKVHDIDAREHAGIAFREGEPDERKIAFIVCANDDLYTEEVTRYLENMNCPEGFTAEVFFVKNAPGMTTGYNIGMNLSDAKYKVYMHQDVFVSDPDFPARLVQTFADTGYDMLGVAGAERLVESGVWWEAPLEEGHMCLWQDWVLSTSGSNMDRGEKNSPLECLDGVLIATSCDVPWRDDIFKGFHFYDISQCLEFKRRALKIGYFDNGGFPGILHEVSTNHSESYNAVYQTEREKFVAEYGEDMKCS